MSLQPVQFLVDVQGKVGDGQAVELRAPTASAWRQGLSSGAFFCGKPALRAHDRLREQRAPETRGGAQCGDDVAASGYGR